VCRYRSLPEEDELSSLFLHQGGQRWKLLGRLFLQWPQLGCMFPLLCIATMNMSVRSYRDRWLFRFLSVTPAIISLGQDILDEVRSIRIPDYFPFEIDVPHFNNAPEIIRGGVGFVVFHQF
jgi:hypothetical protein